MNIRTLTTAATWLAVAAATFAGCAAEETTDTPTSSPANNANNANVTNTGTAGGMGPGNTTTINTAAAVTNTSGGTSAGTTGGAGPTTGATVAGVTNATVAGVTNATAAANTSGGANNTTGGGASCDAPAAMGTAPIIDDFEDNDHTISDNEGRLGYWYQYGDSNGDQTTVPLEGAETTDGKLHSDGSGFMTYVGFGVDLNNDNAAGEPCDYDASVHTGVQFDLVNDVDVYFQVAMAATVADDSDHYRILVPAGTNTGFKAAFSALERGDWGTDTVAFDASKVLQLQWQVADATMPFSITLDNVSFY